MDASDFLLNLLSCEDAKRMRLVAEGIGKLLW
jgi:hypothetical protein